MVKSNTSFELEKKVQFCFEVEKAFHKNYFPSWFYNQIAITNPIIGGEGNKQALYS